MRRLVFVFLLVVAALPLEARPSRVRPPCVNVLLYAMRDGRIVPVGAAVICGWGFRVRALTS